MSYGNTRNDSNEMLLLIGALAGLCMLLAGTIFTLSVRTASEIARIEAGPITEAAPEQSLD